MNICPEARRAINFLLLALGKVFLILTTDKEAIQTLLNASGMLLAEPYQKIAVALYTVHQHSFIQKQGYLLHFVMGQRIAFG